MYILFEAFCMLCPPQAGSDSAVLSHTAVMSILGFSSQTIELKFCQHSLMLVSH